MSAQKKLTDENKHFIDCLVNSQSAVRLLSREGLIVGEVCLKEPVPTITLLRPPPRHRFKTAWSILRTKSGGGRIAKMVTFINKCKIIWWEDYR